MFGAIVSGRLVQTNFIEVSPARFVTTFPDADSINHIVVFLTGVQPFPDGTAGLVYFSWPQDNTPTTWQLLGHISNEKPSAIFKISNIKRGTEISGESFIFGQQQIPHVAQIGISVEPILDVQQQSALIVSETSDKFNTFGQKMLENFLNFVSSYSVTQAQMTQNSSETYIPLSTLQIWYNNFQRRLKQNPYFWRS